MPQRTKCRGAVEICQSIGHISAEKEAVTYTARRDTISKAGSSRSGGSSRARGRSGHGSGGEDGEGGVDTELHDGGICVLLVVEFRRKRL